MKRRPRQVRRRASVSAGEAVLAVLVGLVALRCLVDLRRAVRELEGRP
jgi:hypothetical protein